MIRWALHVEHTGSDYYWTSDGAPLASDDGDLAVLGGLDALSVREELPVVGSEADRRSVSLTLQWPTDHAAEAAQGLDLTPAVGTIYLIEDGKQIEDGRVIVSGPLSQPTYGGVGEPVAFTIGGEPYDDAAQVPDAGARITLTTWSGAPESSLGKWYPMVWGRPGVVDDGGEVTGSPAYAVEMTGSQADTLLIAAHRVSASTVHVQYETTGGVLASASASVTEQADGAGRIVSTVDVSGLAVALREANAWSIRWSGGSGALSPFNNGVVNTLGEAGRWLAQLSTVDQDAAAWAAAMQRYPWPSSGWIEEPASPMAVLRDQILPALPIALCWGRRGMRPVRFAYDAGPGEVVDHLIAGRDCARVGPVTYERNPRDIAQEIRVGYGGDAQERWVVMRADGWEGTDYPEYTSSVWSRAARQRWRTSQIRSEEVLCPSVWLRSTAANVALWQARINGASPRSVEYDCGPDRIYLDLGEVVWLTDVELSESKTLAIVVARQVRLSGAVRIGLKLLPGWDVQQRGEPAGRSNETPTYSTT